MKNRIRVIFPDTLLNWLNGGDPIYTYKMDDLIEAKIIMEIITSNAINKESKLLEEANKIIKSLTERLPDDDSKIVILTRQEIDKWFAKYKQLQGEKLRGDKK
jgi:hypothetical protein